MRFGADRHQADAFCELWRLFCRSAMVCGFSVDVIDYCLLAADGDVMCKYCNNVVEISKRNM